MPFADYEDFDACVRANSDKRDPSAYCAVIKRQVEGKLGDEYTTKELLELKEELDLNDMEFLEALKLLERNSDASDLSVGDWVMINIGNESTLGRISGQGKESRTEEGNTIDGEDGVADVFRVDVWDDEAEELDESVIHPASRLDPRDAPDGFSGKAELTEEERTPPESAQENAQMALDARDEVGGDCGTDEGWERANQLANGEALSEDTIEQMAQFNRHRDNSDMSDDEGRADCGWQMWKAWGGDEGIDWAIRMSDKMDEKDTESE